MKNMEVRNMKILIVEDEKRIARFIQLELKHEGFDTAIESNGKRAFERIIQEDYDLVLLDVMLPEMDGIEICRRVRELSDIPIIMLTAKDDIDDKVNGLDVGADDYMTKPFAVPELLARIRATLRNHSNHGEMNDLEENRSLMVKNLILYPERSEVQIKIDHKTDNKEEKVKIELNDKEYALLEYLVKNRQDSLTRDEILKKIWDDEDNISVTAVEDCIRSLRNKIDEKFGEKYIQAVGNKSYKIMEQDCTYFVKDIILFPDRFEVEFKDEPIELTKREYTLLEYLVKNKRKVLTRDQILQAVWGYDYVGDTNVVDVYIRYLRSKIDDRFGEKYIHTVRGVGYVIKES